MRRRPQRPVRADRRAPAAYCPRCASGWPIPGWATPSPTGSTSTSIPATHCTVHRTDDLEAVAADVLGRPLDRRRPLWEMHVVEGLPDGRTGMIMKLHHALLDGPSGAELMVQLLDLEPTPTAPATAGGRWPSTRSPLAPSWTGWPGDGPVGRRPGRRRRCATPSTCWPPRSAGIVEHPDVEVPGQLRALPARCSTGRSPLDAPCASPASPLDAVDKARRDTGSTVNDVVLAVTGGALRRYLLPPRRAARLATAGDGARCRHVTGSRRRAATSLSALITTLATDIGDPIERLAQITRVTNAVKRPPRRHRASDRWSDSLDVVPPRAGQDWPASSAACAWPDGVRCPSTSSSPTCPGRTPPSTATARSWNRRTRWARSPTGRRST